MGDRDISAFVQAREHLFACDGTVDDKMLGALETILKEAHEAGSVTVEIRCVSRADRRGDRLTKFASDIRYARALYDIAPWALHRLMARVRELEAEKATLPAPAGTAGDAMTHFVIPEQAGLDLVRVVLIDHAPGKGTVIVQCYNEAWTTYFGAMGNRTLEQFIASVDRSYLGGALRVRNATYGARIANAVILACRERAALASSTRTTDEGASA